tara:strand:- start:469 stop:747 length:279 start_codon:yes stop_codon:yes gene_type:complete
VNDQGHPSELDYVTAKQNGVDCWFIATDRQLRRRGLHLPDSWSIKMWRDKSRQWMQDRSSRFIWFGEDDWSFVNDWKTAVITELAMVAALSV